MGRRGPLPKPEDKRQGHRTRGALIPLEGGIQAPDPDAEWTEVVKEAWLAYWESDVASAAQPTTLPALKRLFTLYDQHERAMAVVRQALVVKGSTGQIRVNPLADYALKVEGQIQKLESEFGLTPTARARLGLSVAQAQEAIEQLASKPIVLEVEDD